MNPHIDKKLGRSMLNMARSNPEVAKRLAEWHERFHASGNAEKTRRFAEQKLMDGVSRETGS